MKNKSKRKSVSIIVALVLVLALLFTLPGIAEPVQDELKRIFLTREEYSTWATEVSKVLETLEASGQVKVQAIVEKEMTRRGIATKSTTS